MEGRDAPKIDDFLTEIPAAEWPDLLRELLILDIHYRRQIGESPTLETYQAEYPTLRLDQLADLFAERSRPAPSSAEGETVQFTPCDAPRPDGELPRIRYLGDYELIEEIARGGMGMVYKARQVSLNRIVAVKTILAGQLATKADHDRFHSEAQAAALLDHANIVPVFEVGEHEGQHYFSMGYVDGSSLSARLAEGPLPPKEAAELVATVAEAVEYAHRQGVIHRDIKPSNILIDSNGRPRITDFGLAKRVGAPGGDPIVGAGRGSDLTATGQVLGTPSYMPPEQAAGQINAVGPAADVYSLGALLYTALTGRPPFQAATALETMQQVLEREPVSPRQLNPAVPKDLETIVLKCLEKSVPRRYATAHALADDLRRNLEGRPILARPVGRWEHTWRWCRRNPVVASLITAVIVSVLTGTAVSGYFAVRERQRANSEETQKELAQAATKSEAVQKGIALAAEKKASDQAKLARNSEMLVRQGAAELRRTLYIADLNRIEQYAAEGNNERVDALLRRHIPHEPGEEDLRGFEWYYWWRRAHEEEAMIRLPAPAEKIAISPDEEYVAAACEGGRAFVWDFATRKRLPLAFQLPGEQHWSALQFTGSSHQLWGSGWSGRCRAWDVARAAVASDSLPEGTDAFEVTRWPSAIAPDGAKRFGPCDKLGCIGIASPNGDKKLLSEVSSGLYVLGSPSRRFFLADILTAKIFQQPGKRTVGVLIRIPDPNSDAFRLLRSQEYRDWPPERWGSPCFAAAFSSDGRILAAGHRQGTLYLYDSEAGTLSHACDAHTGIVWACAVLAQ